MNKTLPEGYQFLYASRKEKRGGGLVLVFKSQTCTAQLIPALNVTHMEIIGAQLNLLSGTKLFFLGIYRPPNACFDTFIEELTDLFRDYISDDTCDDFLLMGDLNVRVDDVGDGNSKKFQNVLSDLGLTQHVTGSTHNRGHTLDLIITPVKSKLIVDTYKSAVVNSDHFGVIAISSECYGKTRTRTISNTGSKPVRSWTKIHQAEFLSYIKSNLECSIATRAGMMLMRYVLYTKLFHIMLFRCLCPKSGNVYILITNHGLIENYNS